MEGEFSGRSPFPFGPLLIPFGAGEKFDTGRLGTQWKIDGPQTGGRFSVVHHQLPPRTLAAPLHRHHREDEHSYVLTGTFGALLGDDVVTAEPGTWVFKPRGQWHTFWNAGDTPCEIIEVISPGGFEDYFRELRAIWPDRTKAAPLLQKYELDMDFDSVPNLCARDLMRLGGSAKIRISTVTVIIQASFGPSQMNACRYSRRSGGLMQAQP